MRGLWSGLSLLAIFLLPLSTAATDNDLSKSGRPAAAIAPTTPESTADDLQINDPAKQSLGAYSQSASISPGMIVGNSWVDFQHNGSMGRMIDWGENNNSVLVHFSWMRLPLENAGLRVYQYNFFDATTGQLANAEGVPVTTDWAGMVGIDVQGNNVPVVGGHERVDDIYQGTFYWDFAPGFLDFSTERSRIPDTLAEYCGPACSSAGNESSWPKFRYQETSPDTVLHVFSQIAKSNPGAPQEIYYFRKIGTGASGTWAFPPYIVDTVFDISQDITASRTTGKVALVWTANISNGGPCDTNSGEQPFVQLDNDVYYQISNNQGTSWEPRVNVTCNVDGEAGYRPYTDLSALIDSHEDLHIVWSGRVWPADPYAGGSIGFDCSIFHWSESVPFIRKVHDAEWDQTTCNGGAWQMNVSKMTISECDGRFYCLWVQFNDIPNGVEDDCAQRGIDGTSISGSANGELWLSISDDGGMNWDIARNLTNTYSPGCDSLNGTVGPCESEHWPSMARFGTNKGMNWGTVPIIDPSGTYLGNHYLDVQYVLDSDPGSIVKDEGTWQLAEIRWFRLACTSPEPNPQLKFSIENISYPTWGKPGQQVDTTLTLTNFGNVDLNYSVVVTEDNGPSGWLTTNGFSGTVPAGINNTETGTIHLNTGGVVDWTRAPEPTIVLKGSLTFNSNAPSTPDVFPILFYITDTLYIPEFDTLYNGSFALTVASNGDFGQLGTGKVNMDFWDSGDCDTVDSIPGATDVYLYDGSPIVSVDDSHGYWSIYGSDGLRPVEPGSGVTDMGAYSEYSSGIFTTADTSIGLEQHWYMPDDPAATFIIQRIRFFSYYMGGSHQPPTISGLSLGAVIDWDIPSDMLQHNVGGNDPTRNLIYQQGYEIGNDDAIECQENDSRFGGVAFLEMFETGNSDQTITDTLTVYLVLATTRTGLSDLQTQIDNGRAFYESTLDPGIGSGDFVGAYTEKQEDREITLPSLTPSQIRYDMLNKNLVDQYNNYSDSIKNQYTVMTFVNDYTLGGSGCCIGIRGNVNGDPEEKVNIADLVCLIGYLFPPVGVTNQCWTCREEANVNGDPDETVNISDVTYLIKYLFGIPNGPAPPACPD